jgi:hypothetical protein
LKKYTLSYLAVILAIAALQFTARHGAAAEYRIQPGISVSEDYNDNVFLTPRHGLLVTTPTGSVFMTPEQDYVTRVVPSVHFTYAAPVWEWDFRYALDYRYYAHGTREHDTTQLLNLTNHTSIVREFVFIDLQDYYRRVSLDTTQDYTQQSNFFNQTDENELILSPYLKINLFSHTSGTTGYQFRNIWYKERSAINKSEQTVFGDFENELSARTQFLVGAKYVRTEARTLTYDRIDLYGGPRYEYAEESTIWFMIGNSWFFLEDNDSGTQASWDVGISHRFVTYTLSFNAALTYIDDPQRVQRREDRYVATFRKETERLGLTGTLGRWEYRNVLTKRLQNTRNSVGGAVSIGLGSSMRASYSLTIDRFEDNAQDTFSMLYLNLARLEYTFPADTMLGLQYRFAHGYSPDAVNYAMNYDNNIVTLELRKLF